MDDEGAQRDPPLQVERGDWSFKVKIIDCAYLGGDSREGIKISSFRTYKYPIILKNFNTFRDQVPAALDSLLSTFVPNSFQLSSGKVLIRLTPTFSTQQQQHSFHSSSVSPLPGSWTYVT